MRPGLLASLPAVITGFIASGGYLGVGALMAVGTACVPIPSEIVMAFAGFLVSQGRFDFWMTVLAGTLGCVAGSAAAYWLGHWGGRPVVTRYRRYVLVSAKDLARADTWFGRYGDSAVFFSRFIPLVRAFISLPAGIAGMPFGRFCLYTFLGSVPWCLGLTYLGVRLGSRWDEISAFFHDFDIVIVAAAVAAGAWWIWRHVREERDASRNEAAVSDREA
ncbi:MAG: DedA family protein [Armatimonadota bacterium]